MKVTVKFVPDSDIFNPAGDAGYMDNNWRLISFNNRHISYENHEKYTNPDIGLRRKLEVGTAFYVDYFEHGDCKWSLSGTGPNCQWDTSRMAGIIIFDNVKDMGAKTLEDRAKDAANFLQIYTDWSNGHGHGYVIQDEDGNDLDSCFGFYDSEIEYTVSEIVSALDWLTKEHGALEVSLQNNLVYSPNMDKIRNYGKVLTF